MKLTIGMATHNDFDGVYFTMQALRMYHQHAVDDDPGTEAMREVVRTAELIVVDNSPSSAHGAAVQSFMQSWVTYGRYIAAPEAVGTAAPRDRVFREASGDVVLCLDCHVLLWPDALVRLVRFFSAHPDFAGLLSGPLVYDGLNSWSTHFHDAWRDEMWGVWAQAWRCPCGEHVFDTSVNAQGEVSYSPLPGSKGVCSRLPRLHWVQHERHLMNAGARPLGLNVLDEPIEIPAMGLGLFACRRDAWLGFSPNFRGFGGEEFYIHEKFRQAGQKCLCLPSLMWLHRFGRPGGVTYPLTRWNKVRNYVIGHTELGLDLGPVHRHFVASGLMPQREWDVLMSDPANPPLELPAAQFPAEGCGSCGKATVPDATTLEHLYEFAAKNPSDINEHVPKLRELAGQVEHATEFGMRRGVSTVALLAGQPARLVSYDLNRDGMADALKTRQGKTRFDFVQGNSLTVDIEPTDLLFIDTVHTAQQLFAELGRHHSKVRRWIAFHDTEIYGETGEHGGPGLLPAIRQFMRDHPEWSVIYHVVNNHGFTVISRDERDKPKLPGKLTLASNFAKAMAAHIADGMAKVQSAELERRLELCTICDQRVDDRCVACGCYLAEKASWRSSECPLGKWPPAETQGAAA